MRFVIVTGMSGAGKSSVLKMLEDVGYFCMDNLPVSLVPKLTELLSMPNSSIDKVALGMDIRSRYGVGDLGEALDQLDEMNVAYEVLFLDAKDNVLIKRYKETRRSHPLAEESDSLEQAIQMERAMLAPLRQRAEHIIDTTNLSTAKLKGMLRQQFARGGSGDGALEVRVLSFGFKYGAPMEADLVFDVRFLPNPYYVPELRAHTGLNQGVRDYVFGGGQADEFMKRLGDLIAWLLPRYVEEGKTALVIGVGCTGGHHRSVAIAHSLAELIRTLGYPVSESHRDMGRN